MTLALAAAMLSCQALLAVTPTPGELNLGRSWAEISFGSATATNPMRLETVEEDSKDTIAWGRSWRGTPFQIGDKTYADGLAFNSTKKLRIHLDRPAARFLSDIGLENNDDTRRGAESGQGSVTFHVGVEGRELFASPVMRLKDPARSINIPLQGARAFDITVGNAGDGRGWDQAVWAGARIEFEDGSSLRLQDVAWAAASLRPAPQFSFTYGGKPSTELLPKWTREARTTPLPGVGQSHEVIYRDPASGLQVRIVAKRFETFPAVEWVAYFKNTGSSDTPLLENIQAMDAPFGMPTAGEPTLHWAMGGVSSFDDFAPRVARLKEGTPFTLTAEEGRSSSEILPFFNIEGSGAGVVLGIGWSGRWSARFEATDRNTVRATAGMALTHLVLHPGEEIRTPSMLALFYQGNRWHGQNLLRQFILTHHRPMKDGKPMPSPITCGNWGGTPASVHLDNIQQFIKHRLPIEYYWIDAEWYGKGGWADNVGNWEVKKDLYPQGFKPLSDLLHTDHRELMVWFEPERVIKGTDWDQQHADWMVDIGGGTKLFNLGNPAACKFVTDFVSSRIEEFGLGCYRQDFNMDPRPYWAKADAPDRQGISEIRHIEGLYAFWDGLLARFPHLIIDNCASGGRRIDLETVGRATPFWRTDGPRDAIAHQCHSYGLLAWVPLSAISQDREGDTYEFRSSMCSSLCINWFHSGDGPRPPFPADFPYDWARRTLEQYVSIRDFYYGDYYPLTSYSQDPGQWMAYQLDRPDTQQGLVVVLRRPESPFEAASFPLQELDPKASYKVTNLDTKREIRRTGQELMTKGVPVEITDKPGSALIVYRKR